MLAWRQYGSPASLRRAADSSVARADSTAASMSAFLLADMEAAVESARATLLSAARRKDAGLPYCRQASIAKLVATEAAMQVTTDAVQVFGGAGYTRDFPVERY